MRSLKNAVLSSPFAYRWHMRLLGGRSIKKKIFAEFLPIARSQEYKILDIGCGPAPDRDLMGDTCWTGLEMEEKYVKFVKRHLRSGDSIIHGGVDVLKSLGVSGYDVVLLSGVIHHLDDEQARRLFEDCTQVLGPTGIVLTIDPVRTEDAGWLENFLINSDRGEFIRNMDGYDQLVPNWYQSRAIHIRRGLGWLPQAQRISVLSR